MHLTVASWLAYMTPAEFKTKWTKVTARKTSACCLFSPILAIYRIIFSLFFVTAGAQAGGVALSIEGAAEYARKHNPSLIAARWRIDEARGRWQQSGRLSNPELE